MKDLIKKSFRIRSCPIEEIWMIYPNLDYFERGSEIVFVGTFSSVGSKGEGEVSVLPTS